MVENRNDKERAVRGVRLLRRSVGLAGVIALAGGGVAVAATGAQGHAINASGGVAAPRAASAAKSGGLLPYTSVKATPSLVKGGGKVTVSGEAPLNAHAGEQITIISNAFASGARVAGTPAIRTQVLVNGRYKLTAPIRRGLKPGNYTIAGRYRGRPFETAASVTVR